MNDTTPSIDRVGGKPPRLPSRRQLGSALLIVLSLVVLSSIIVLTFLSQSLLVRLTAKSSENSIKADLMARTALDEIVLSLREEIFSGSSDKTVSGITIYTPATTQSSFPSRSVLASIPANNSNFANLLKQSGEGIATYSSTNLSENYPKNSDHPPVIPASSVATSVPAKNGRFLSAKRWNTPRLLNGSGLADTQLPYWVYFTRSGPFNGATDANVSTMVDRNSTNRFYATGRYAYQVYDISGLLDINLAGHPAGFSAKEVNELKGTLSGSILTAIPGIPSPGNLMDWKIGTESIAQFFTNQIADTNGYLIPAKTEHRFFNRQDLLRYVSQTNSISTNALPYLTIFNRKRNAPVFSYPKTGQVTANTPNASPLEIRMATGGVSPLDNFTWRQGDPAVPRRFPLSRLSWLRYDGPSQAASAGMVKSAFGLIWDDRTPSDSSPENIRGDRWVYVGSSGSDSPDTPASSIKTLEEVAAEGREPNFFELLKAAIHKGSLGQAVAGTFAPDTDIFYALPDLHILRIGACIIDQYDSDSYPTLINFSVEDGTINPKVEVHGVEDLPYVSRIAPFYINPDWPNDPGPSARRMEGFLVPELWNPHQAGGTSSAKPSELRLFFTGEFSLRTGVYLTRANQFNLLSGAAILPEASFASFYEPRPITRTTSQRTGNFNIDVPFKDFPIGSGDTIVGLALQGLAGNMTPQPPPSAAEWDGYQLTQNQYREFWIRDWFGGQTGGTPFNSILQFKNSRGKFQNYNVFASGFYTDNAALNTALGVHNAGSSAANGFRKEDFPYPYANAWQTNAPPLSNAALPGGGLATSPPDRWEDLLTIRRQGGHHAFKPDPRTARLGVGRYFFNSRTTTGGFNWTPEYSFATGLRPVNSGNMARGPIAKYPEVSGHPLANLTLVSGAQYRPAMFERNVSGDGSGSYYQDNDGIVRPGDNHFQAWSDSVYNQTTARPILLNRPFRTVGELGAVFRDLPHKTLDLSSEVSADAALLDFFCLNESPPVIGGVVNINKAPAEVLKSLLQETSRDVEATNTISASEAQAIANDLVARRMGAPANQVAGLVQMTTTNTVTSAQQGAYPGIKTKREAVVRSLASIHNERTWNFFIDVIAQTGKFSPQATRLSDFIVEGERRYWLHVAIDRYTGEVVDELREMVLE